MYTRTHPHTHTHCAHAHTHTRAHTHTLCVCAYSVCVCVCVCMSALGLQLSCPAIAALFFLPRRAVFKRRQARTCEQERCARRPAPPLRSPQCIGDVSLFGVPRVRRTTEHMYGARRGACRLMDGCCSRCALQTTHTVWCRRCRSSSPNFGQPPCSHIVFHRRRRRRRRRRPKHQRGGELELPGGVTL